MLVALDMSNLRILNVASPSASTDAVNKTYVDNLLGGLAWKNEVRAATTANGTLASAFANGQTIDGVTLVTGDRILIKNQSNPIENGIYIVAASGAPARSFDADAAGDLNNATVSVTEGTVNEGLSFTQNEISPAPGTDANNWVQSLAGVSYTSDDGLQLIGNAFSILLDSDSGLVVSGAGLAIDPDIAGDGLLWSAGELTIDPATMARKFAASVGNGSNTALTVTHNFGSRDVDVEVFDNATYETVGVNVTRPTTNTVQVEFATAPASNAYRVVVRG